MPENFKKWPKKSQYFLKTTKNQTCKKYKAKINYIDSYVIEENYY